MGLGTLNALHSGPTSRRPVNLCELALSSAQLEEGPLLFLLGERHHERQEDLPGFHGWGLWLLRHLRLGSLRLGCEAVRVIVMAMPRLETLELTRMPLIEAAPSEEQHEML